MKKLSGHYPRLAAWALLTALLAACGNKTLTSSNAPSIIYSHIVAFNNSILYAWGVNTYGQLGNGDNTGATQLSPVKISSATFTNVSSVSAGATHTLAYMRGGTVWAWGNNGFGQVGNNTSLVSTVPAQVLTIVPGSNPVTTKFLTDISAVAAGGYHSLALDKSNHVWAWGSNIYGQLGNGTISNSFTAMLVQDQFTAPLATVTKIAAGGSHNLAVQNGGSVVSWGYNGFGQLGQQSNPTGFQNFSTSTNRLLPVSVTKSDAAKTDPKALPIYDGSVLTNVIDIAAGANHSLFLTGDHNIWACGYNALGQLGVGDTTDRNHGAMLVIDLPPGVTPIAVAAGLDHSLVLMSDHTVYAWGNYFYGQVGNGMIPSGTVITAQTTPVQVLKSAGVFLPNVTKIVAIGNSSFAVDSDGQLWAWGQNTFGQLGQGGSDTSNRYYATKVPGIFSVKSAL